MKPIREFIAGKIRRSETGDLLSLETGGPAHDHFGAHEGTLVGPKGKVTFYERGLVAADGAELAYEALERVELSAGAPGEVAVDLITKEGTKRFLSSRAGGEVVHATLRWVGNTRLGRKLAE